MSARGGVRSRGRPSRGRGAPLAFKTAKSRPGGEWWRELEGDDVISLEPLCELAYEPFALPSTAGAACVGSAAAEGSSAFVDAYNYFDGKILSRYLISSGEYDTHLRCTQFPILCCTECTRCTRTTMPGPKVVLCVQAISAIQCLGGLCPVTSVR
jgi:hypothetical protein